jgi:hypothetical protein
MAVLENGKYAATLRLRRSNKSIYVLRPQDERLLDDDMFAVEVDNIERVFEMHSRGSDNRDDINVGVRGQHIVVVEVVGNSEFQPVSPRTLF